MSEVIFEVREDVADGGFTASALGFGIHTQVDTLEALRANVREAVDCYFHKKTGIGRFEAYGATLMHRSNGHSTAGTCLFGSPGA